jgi:hypothetical protein
VVTEQVHVLQAARSRKEAHEQLLRGDLGGAKRSLRKAMCTLSEISGQELELAQAQFDLDELERGEWTESSSKRLFSTQRSTQSGRKSRFDENP